MNGLALEYTQLSIIIHVALRLLTAVIFLSFVLPLVFKEAGVKNGLRALRIEMILTTAIVFLIAEAGLTIIVTRYLGYPVGTTTEFVTYFNDFGFFFYMILKAIIYRQKYSPESKELHAKFEKLEREMVEKKKLDK